jgi:lipoprotein-releasing system permease protein
MKHKTAKMRWIWYVASRYIFRRRGNSPSAVLAIIGIATGVLSLIVILAVMNGFQLGFIDSILEISSCHVRVEAYPPEELSEALDVLQSIPEINAALPFREFQALVRGSRGGQHALVVRGIPSDADSFDRGMISRLDFEDGGFNLEDPRSVLLGSELARRLGVRPGDEITLYSISGILSGADAEQGADDGAGIDYFTVTGVFRTGFYEFDTGWGFINIDSAAAFSDTAPVLGIKLKNRFQDRYALELTRDALTFLPGFDTARFSSWRDYNKSFFGALRTEKLFMFILVGLIFIVVGLNIYQAQRRSVLERREEIGLLRAIGGGERAVRFVFVCDGALIGFTGSAAGLLIGLLIASNISVFFSVLEGVVNFFIHLLNILAGALGFGAADNFEVFSPAVFYIKEIPSRIIPREIVIICLFGFLSALAAAWFASGKVSRIRPAEVLRYE